MVLPRIPPALRRAGTRAVRDLPSRRLHAGRAPTRVGVSAPAPRHTSAAQAVRGILGRRPWQLRATPARCRTGRRGRATPSRRPPVPLARMGRDAEPRAGDLRAASRTRPRSSGSRAQEPCSTSRQQDPEAHWALLAARLLRPLYPRRGTPTDGRHVHSLQPSQGRPRASTIRLAVQ